MTIKHPEDFAGLEPPPTPDIVFRVGALVHAMAFATDEELSRAASMLEAIAQPNGAYQPAAVTRCYERTAEWCAAWARRDRS